MTWLGFPEVIELIHYLHSVILSSGKETILKRLDENFVTHRTESVTSLCWSDLSLWELLACVHISVPTPPPPLSPISVYIFIIIKSKWFLNNNLWLVGWLVVFNVPSAARSFRDGGGAPHLLSLAKDVKLGFHATSAPLQFRCCICHPGGGGGGPFYVLISTVSCGIIPYNCFVLML